MFRLLSIVTFLICLTAGDFRVAQRDVFVTKRAASQYVKGNFLRYFGRYLTRRPTSRPKNRYFTKRPTTKYSQGNPCGRVSILARRVCPAGMYYDAENACTCRPCLSDNCCPGRGVAVECPPGSHQPNRGQATCELAVVWASTAQFRYNVTIPLFAQMNRAIQKSVTKVYDVNKCPSGISGTAAVFISGFNLPSIDEDAKVSIKVQGFSLNARKTIYKVSKLPQSRIAGFAAGVISSCLASSEFSFGNVMVHNLVSSKPQTKVVQSGVVCTGTVPRAFAALNQISSLSNGGVFSLRMAVSVGTDQSGEVEPRVTFETSTAIQVAGAQVVAFCSSSSGRLATSVINSGVIVGGAVPPRSNVTKTITFEHPMECIPDISLGLTKLDAREGLAVNLELLAYTITKTSFQMAFFSMGPTIVSSIEGAYLASCGMDSRKPIEKSIQEACSGPGGRYASQRPTRRPTRRPRFRYSARQSRRPTRPSRVAKAGRVEENEKIEQVGKVAKGSTEEMVPEPEVLDKKYFYVKQRLGWNDAQEACARGAAQLAMIHSLEEHARVSKACQGECWLGADRSDETESFKWNDESAMDFEKWADGEPRHEQESGLCAKMTKSDNGWASADCSEKLGFVCQKMEWGSQKQASVDDSNTFAFATSFARGNILSLAVMIVAVIVVGFLASNHVCAVLSRKKSSLKNVVTDETTPLLLTR